MKSRHRIRAIRAIRGSFYNVIGMRIYFPEGGGGAATEIMLGTA
jgi:hypothetical protein